MTRQLFVGTAVVVGLLLSGTGASAQQTPSTSDIQRLQDQAYQVGRDVSQLRSSNPDLASRLEGDLDDLRDEIVYLKVKLRKEGSLGRTEYDDVRVRLQDLRSKARAEESRDYSSSSSSGSSSSRTGGIQEGVAGGVAGGTTGSTSGGVSTEGRRPPPRAPRVQDATVFPPVTKSTCASTGS